MYDFTITFMGSGGVEITQLNTLESRTQETAFKKLSYCSRTIAYCFIYCLSELCVSVSYMRETTANEIRRK